MPSALQRRRRTPELQLDCSLAAKQATAFSAFSSPDCQSVGERYDVSEALGQGTTAVVYKARRRADGEEVALKVLRIDDEELLHMARDEFSLLKGIEHPHIIRVHEIFTYPQGVVLVLEFIGGKCLDRMVRRMPNRCFPEKVYRNLFRALMEAIAYLHQHSIIHRDVKAANVLVDASLQDLKLCDFNVARTVLDGGALSMTGTLDYLPVEVLMGESHTAASDIWGAGLCLYFMISGIKPIERLAFASQRGFVTAIVARMEAPFNLPLWADVPEECKTMLWRCLAIENTQRPSATQVINSDWLAPEGWLKRGN